MSDIPLHALMMIPLRIGDAKVAVYERYRFMDGDKPRDVWRLVRFETNASRLTAQDVELMAALPKEVA